MKFEPTDFNAYYDDVNEYSKAAAEESAAIANAKLEEWLSKAPRVYKSGTDVRDEWTGKAISTLRLANSTHTARLVQIEKL